DRRAVGVDAGVLPCPRQRILLRGAVAATIEDRARQQDEGDERRTALPHAITCLVIPSDLQLARRMHVTRSDELGSHSIRRETLLRESVTPTAARVAPARGPAGPSLPWT